MNAHASLRCHLVERDAAGKVSGGMATRSLDELPPGDVTIAVEYSSVNYKDALAATGHPGVVRTFPHVPGIDAVGTVVASSSTHVTTGQHVLVTGYQLGAERWGGWAERIRVPAEWVIPLPATLSAREAMIYGTAGFTAALGVDIIRRHGIEPNAGEVVVTGASGGVGCLAVAILGKLGYRVTAVSGKPAAATLLRELGASEVVGREALQDDGKKPLLGARWAAAIDTVGGAPLAHVVRSAQRGACITACGMLAGVELPLNVYPFILRGVMLAGIDSAECPRTKRLEIWSKLASEWRPPRLERTAREVALGEVASAVQQLLDGAATGRTVVRVA